MKSSLFLFLMFTLSACGNQPDWSGDWSECQQLVEGACIRGDISSQDVTRALAFSRQVFDTPDQPGASDLDIRGYIIEMVPTWRESGCSSFAGGCVSRERKHIWVIRDQPGTICVVFILGHEFGHIMRPTPEDDGHSACVWYVWDHIWQAKLCPNVVPPLDNRTCY
jgi:hypothetical protein